MSEQAKNEEFEKWFEDKSPSAVTVYEFAQAAFTAGMKIKDQEIDYLKAQLRHEQRQVRAKTELMNKAYKKIEEMEKLLKDIFFNDIIGGTDLSSKIAQFLSGKEGEK